MFDALVSWTKDFFGSMGIFGLFLLAVAESIFFPIPVDVLLIVLAVADPSLWWVFALVATIGSVLGAAIAYRIGYYGEQLILERFFPKKHIERVHQYFEKYESLAIFIAGFTPLPYKLFALAAGVFYINFTLFLIVSFLARGLRFFIVAFIAAWLSEHALGPIMNWIMVLGVLFALEVFIARKIWFRQSANFK